MSENNGTLTELFRLIEQQLEALKGKLEPQDVVAYCERKRRIDALVQRLAANGERQSP